MERHDIFTQNECAIWLKGNLHCHSTFSDGNLSPNDILYNYKHHGYDFLSITDHEIFTDCNHLTQKFFTMLSGAEITGYTSTNKRIHINIFWSNDIGLFKAGESVILKDFNDTFAFLQKAKDNGCYIMLNHPHWSMINSNDIQGELLFDAIEIYNYSTEWIENMGESSILWEELLSRGEHLWGGGSDDNHNRFPVDSISCDSFGGFTVVKAESNSDIDILKALKTGSFYTSTGPQIYQFYIEDNEVFVNCSPCKRIIINGNERQYQRVLGKYVTEFRAKLSTTETFVRVECMDAAGNTAYSNPIFIKR